MATSKIMVDEGSTTNLATVTISEDAATKHVSRTILNRSDGTEVGTASVPLRVDVTGSTTQPVSASALPLPTGASTEATLLQIRTGTNNIPSLGQAVAGASLPVVLTAAQISSLTPQTDALTNTQLRATAVPVSGTFYQATQPVSGSVTATLSAETTKVIGTVNVSAGQSIAVTNAGTFASQATLQAGSALVGKVGIDQTTPGTTNRVDVGTINSVAPAFGTGVRGATVQRVTIATDDSVPVTLAANQSVNVNQINGVTPLMGNGVTGTGSQRVTIASDNTPFGVKVASGGIASGAIADGADVTLGAKADAKSTATDTTAVTVMQVLKQISYSVQTPPATAVATSITGGATPYKLVSAATTNATSVKGSAGTVYMITASNVNAAVRYLKIYNKASAPTVGTDTPVFTFAIPGNAAGAGTNIPVPTCGIALGTGIAFALTTESTDAGTTGVAANEIVVNIAYA